MDFVNCLKNVILSCFFVMEWINLLVIANI